MKSKKAPKSTPSSVMGSKGKTATIKPEHYVCKPTKMTKFPG